MKNIKCILSLVLISVFILTTSCNKQKTVYKEYQKIPNWNWRRIEKPIIAFEFTIEEAGNYDIIVALRHNQQYEHNQLRTTIELKMPTSENRLFPYNFQISNPEGVFTGECMGDICDLEKTIFKNIKLSQTGTYRIEIENIMKTYDVHGLMEVGLIVLTGSGDSE